MLHIPRVTPGSGFPADIAQFWAILRAEATMQWRRWGFWLAYSITGVLLLLVSVVTAFSLLHPSPLMEQIYKHYTSAELNNVVTYGVTYYAVVVFGLVGALLIVDRLRRDQQVGVVELQRATPLGDASYTLGKFLGNYVAVFIPTLLVYLLCALAPAILGMPTVVILLFLLAFLLVFVPASLVSVGLILLLASVFPVRVVQVGFSALWLLFNVPAWHVFFVTIFNPNGYYIYPLFFPTPLFSTEETSLSKALLNIAVLVLTGSVALCLTYISLAWQRRRVEDAIA
ncbi:hypothetical protein KSD_51740 [Ktedonobacter sp. SOSP1-85]|uniref:hypothetical protein n=1 Tax=Ktedonobacter sp. SOSP1-85 TaxID=2778367 RepID=UPI0019161949|nr:hypothetical protein [Ktedonobacter sp. SOSP1-85]GHO77403.1 hypothetical protein KSD_51740 [Ktedonobacter sp. SOSP1-85]